MSINLSDELHAATTKGKLASAKEVYLDGDKENLQQVGEKTHQLEEAVKGIGVSGGASVATAVSYDNKTSGMTSVTAQGVIDELAAKDKSHDAEIAKKANTSDVDSKMQEEQERVNAELDKKFDKENIAQELGDSEDKVVSQFALPFRVEESEEFLYLIKDGEDHVLFGIQQDGSVEWQVGIPSPIRTKIQEIINQSQQDKTDLSDALNAAKDELNAALQAYKQTTDAAITSLQDTKVDKEEGKSLIEDEVKAHFEVIENDEWFNAMVDEENHILFGIKRDTGKPYFPLNEMYHVEQNEEFFALWLDAEDHILMGIRRDGQIVGEIHAVNALKESISAIQSNIETLQGNITTVGDKITTIEGSVSILNTKVSTIDSSLQELLNVFSLQENPEFMAVETDEEGRILASTNADGSHYSYNLKSETIPEEFSHVDDPEDRISMETDADGKIMAYRDKDGVQHEHELEAKTLHVSSLNLKDNSVNDIQSALIANGFNVKTPIDWSDKSYIYLPVQPTCALMNITGIDDMPTSKTQNLHAYADVWDKNGNYFKKKVILNAQGNSSMYQFKKNFAMDFCEDEWVGDNTTTVKIGDWVSQDSYHFKAYYTDLFKMACPVGYKLFEKIVKTKNFCKQRPYMDYFAYKYTESNSPSSDLNQNLEMSARCFPDGFPVIVYLNNEFYGIFSWQLKKHRDNFHMDRNDVLNIHLDGDLGVTQIWGGNVLWTGFEIRNPKPKSSKWKLLCQDGTKYDGDSPKELMGENSEHYNPEDVSCQKSTKVKKAIQELSKYMAEIKVFEDAYSNAEELDKPSKLLELKTEIEKRFSMEWMIDYLILNNTIQNGDSVAKNWQWVTWGEQNGKVKWYAMPYDLDGSFGISSTTSFAFSAPYKTNTGATTNTPARFVWDYYLDDLKDRYAELRKVNVISYEVIFNLVLDWVKAVGYNNYELEYNKWDESPCNRDSQINPLWKVTNVMYTTWNDSATSYSSSITYGKDAFVKVNRRLYKSLQDNNVGHNPLIESEWWKDVTIKPGNYTKGDVVFDGYSNFYQFEAIENIVVSDDMVNRPFKTFYNSYPREGGVYDSIYRISKWIKRKIEIMDIQFDYNK